MSLLPAHELGLGGEDTGCAVDGPPGQMWAALPEEWGKLWLWLQLEATEFAE